MAVRWKMEDEIRHAYPAENHPDFFQRYDHVSAPQSDHHTALKARHLLKKRYDTLRRQQHNSRHTPLVAISTLRPHSSPAYFDSQTQPYHGPQHINTNLWRPLDPCAAQSIPQTTATNSWCMNQMFEAHKDSVAPVWRVESPLTAYAARDIREWECPSLVGGNDGGNGTSPTVSLNSWSTFDPLSNLEDDKFVSPTGIHDSSGPSARHAQYEASHHAENLTSATSSFNGVPEAPSQPTNFTDFRPVLDNWQWPSNIHISSIIPNNSWITSNEPIASFPSDEIDSSGNAFPSFTSFEQMPSFGYTEPYEFATAQYQQQEHVVPELLCNSGSAATICTSSEGSTVPDEESEMNYDTLSLPDNEVMPTSPEEDLDDDDAEDEDGDDENYKQDAADNPPAASSSVARSQRIRAAMPLAREDINNRDQFLLQSRRSGLPYREIKIRGGFTEAESTLRGRMRILSKPKHERVRKPQWNEDDIMLLHQAVSSFNTTPIIPSFIGNQHLILNQQLQLQPPPPQSLNPSLQATGSDGVINNTNEISNRISRRSRIENQSHSLRRRIRRRHRQQQTTDSETTNNDTINGSLLALRPPWKKVSEWMCANGASYPFAPATCAKKWKSLLRGERKEDEELEEQNEESE